MELDFAPLTKPLSDHSFHVEGEEGGVLNEAQQRLVTRAKTSLRIRYEAEVEVIRRKLGNLEDIRKTLGLSQRKISQLLFVDPSAWTRWTKSGAGNKDSAPPHIYRMLQWYLALEDKYPALDTGFWLSTVARLPNKEMDQEAALIKSRALEFQIDEIKKTLAQIERQFDLQIGDAFRIAPWAVFALSILAGCCGYFLRARLN